MCEDGVRQLACSCRSSLTRTDSSFGCQRALRPLSLNLAQSKGNTDEDHPGALVTLTDSIRAARIVL